MILRLTVHGDNVDIRPLTLEEIRANVDATDVPEDIARKVFATREAYHKAMKELGDWFWGEKNRGESWIS